MCSFWLLSLPSQQISFGALNSWSYQLVLTGKGPLGSSCCNPLSSAGSKKRDHTESGPHKTNGAIFLFYRWPRFKKPKPSMQDQSSSVCEGGCLYLPKGLLAHASAHCSLVFSWWATDTQLLEAKQFTLCNLSIM